MFIPTGVRRFACVLLCAGTVSAATPTGEPRPVQISSAYYHGQQVKLTLDGLMSTKSTARLGPWVLGARLQDGRPHDNRKNLYVVFPGVQYHNDGWPDYDLNCVVNSLPVGDEPVEWDVYFALVLDPSVQDDFRDENDLVLAGQASFRPADLMEFQDVPASLFLRTRMKIDSLTGLARFRHKNGMLPRVAILPAGFAVRATVQSMEAVPSTEYRVSNEKKVSNIEYRGAGEKEVPSTVYRVPSEKHEAEDRAAGEKEVPSTVYRTPSAERKAVCHSGPDYRICNYEQKTAGTNTR